MQGCNDCSFDYDGNLWVTAPAGEISPHPFRRSTEVRFTCIFQINKIYSLNTLEFSRLKVQYLHQIFFNTNYRHLFTFLSCLSYKKGDKGKPLIQSKDIT